MTNLRKTLLKLCKERDLSLAALARKSGVALGTIQGWTSPLKNKEPRISHLQKVASVLEVSIYFLMWGENDPHEKLGQEVLKELFSGDVRIQVSRIERVGGSKR